MHETFDCMNICLSLNTHQFYVAAIQPCRLLGVDPEWGKKRYYTILLHEGMEGQQPDAAL